MFVVARADCRLARSASLSVADLAAETYIALGRNTSVRTLLDKTTQENAANLQSTYDVSTAEAALRLVHAGLGFTIVDPFAIQEELLDGLAFVPWEPRVYIDFGVFHQQDDIRHQAADAFAQRVGDICTTINDRFAARHQHVA